MNVFLAAIVFAIGGAVLAQYVLTDYARQDAVHTFSATTSRP